MTSLSGSLTVCCAMSRARISFCHSGGAPSAAMLLAEYVEGVNNAERTR